MVLAIFVELAGSAIQAQGDVFTGHKTCLVNGLQNQLDRGFMATFHLGCKTAFVTHGGADALVVQNALECVEHFRTVTQSFAERGCAYRNDHELLQVEVVVCVFAAVDHVHHRHRHLHATHATKVAVQRQARFFGCGAGHSHGYSQHRIGTQATLIFRTVQINQRLVQESLFRGIQAQDGLRNFGVDMLYGLQHTLAQIAGFVAISQFDGFTATSGGARRHSGTAHGAAFQQHVALDRGVATGVQNFTSYDIYDCTHWLLSVVKHGENSLAQSAD